MEGRTLSYLALLGMSINSRESISNIAVRWLTHSHRGRRNCMHWTYQRFFMALLLVQGSVLGSYWASIPAIVSNHRSVCCLIHTSDSSKLCPIVNGKWYSCIVTYSNVRCVMDISNITFNILDPVLEHNISFEQFRRYFHLNCKIKCFHWNKMK